MSNLSPTESPASAQRRHWALAVLCLLRERPMHPYEMRRLMRERHKDDRLVLKPGSLYNAVAWLQQQALIAATVTERVGNRPERTTYRILPAGEQQLGHWIGAMIETLQRDVSSFAVALDQLAQVPAADAARHLAARRDLLARTIGELEHTLARLTPAIGRIHLLEVEHDLVLYRTQRTWIAHLLTDLAKGRLSWGAPPSSAESAARRTPAARRRRSRGTR
jgi:DNA-binding PadR family transcriptional regulator